MATSESTANFLKQQVSGAGKIRTRKMFGEYALYCDEKVVALLCDNSLFVKITKTGKIFAENAEEIPPYPSSKPYLLIEEHKWEDTAWLTELIRITAAELPKPKPKKVKNTT